MLMWAFAVRDPRNYFMAETSGVSEFEAVLG
jgi:hypothetical protein